MYHNQIITAYFDCFTRHMCPIFSSNYLCQPRCLSFPSERPTGPCRPHPPRLSACKGTVAPHSSWLRPAGSEGPDPSSDNNTLLFGRQGAYSYVESNNRCSEQFLIPKWAIPILPIATPSVGVSENSVGSASMLKVIFDSAIKTSAILLTLGRKWSSRGKHSQKLRS